MTEREQRLTDHLAGLCGWTKEAWEDVDGPTRTPYEEWVKLDGSMVAIEDFNPLHDPRDTSVVMEAWRRKGIKHCVTVSLCIYNCTAFAHNSNGDCIMVEASTWTEAVCLAIGRASRFDGEGK